MEALLGPTAALVGAIAIIGFLGKILLDYIAYLKSQVAIALTGWREQTAATDRLADAIESESRPVARRTSRR